jgi:hypothetical protein
VSLDRPILEELGDGALEDDVTLPFDQFAHFLQSANARWGSDEVARSVRAAWTATRHRRRAISAALELQGTTVGPLRSPLQALPAERVEELRRILVRLDVIPSK